MPITEGTQPAVLQWTGAWTTNQTTASFTPESGALLVALVSGDGAANSPITGAVTDSLGGTWTLLKRQNAGTATLGGLAEVWCRDSPGTALTVSVKNNNELGAGSTGGQLVVRTLIGALAAASQTGATGGASPSTGAVQVSVAAGTGNRVYGAAFNYDTSTAMSALANTTVISAFADTTNGDDWEAFKSSADTAGTATYGYSTSHNGMIAAAEILAAAGGGGGPTAQPQPGSNVHRNRFYRRQVPPFVLTAGPVVTSGPPVYPLTGPVGLGQRLPPPTAGAAGGSPGLFAQTGPPVTPLRAPVQARPPLPRRGRTASATG